MFLVAPFGSAQLYQEMNLFLQDFSVQNLCFLNLQCEVKNTKRNLGEIISLALSPSSHRFFDGRNSPKYE